MNAFFESTGSGVMALRTEFAAREFFKWRFLMRRIRDIGVAAGASKITMKGTHRDFMTYVTRHGLRGGEA
jgi:hypothetical protein